MISAIDYIQLKAYARQDGFLMGCLWIFTFGCFVASMNQPELQIGFLIGLTLTPVLAYMRLKKFRDKVRDGFISYRRAVAFGTFTMAYASVIIAAATFVYFYFFDKGQFMGMIMENASMPDFKRSFVDAGLSEKELEMQLSEIARSRPIDMAFSIFSNGLWSGIVLSLILGLFIKKKERTNNQ